MQGFERLGGALLDGAVGRPSLPATRMAAVLTLQVLDDYSDRETAEAARFDVRWKVAIGAPLDDPGFDPSSLVYWRNRIARSARPHRISDAVRKIVEETGVLRGRRRRAVDSAILAGAVATQDTVTQLVAAIGKVAREVPGAAEQVAAVCTGHDHCRPGRPVIGWDDPAAKDALVPALVSDANALVAALQDRDLDERAASALALLALVAGQDVEPAGGSDGTGGRWRIARKVAGDRVICTAGPDARHARRGAICDAGHRAVIKPKPLQAPVQGGFTVDDFAADEQAGTATCPAGHTVTLSRTRIATFGARCRDCPLRARCTTCKTGRTLVLHPRDDLLRTSTRPSSTSWPPRTSGSSIRCTRRCAAGTRSARSPGSSAPRSRT